MNLLLKSILIALLSICFSQANAQTLDIKDSTALAKQMAVFEEALNIVADSMIMAYSPVRRKHLSYNLVQLLVKALKTPNSFNYPFENLTGISLLKAPDESFRIFTWQIMEADYTYRYFGAIQMNSDELKLFPLVDYSQVINEPHAAIVGNDRWMGALYYDIIQTKDKERNYYTLLAWDGNNALSTKKMIEVLWFSDEGTPRFGAPVFNYNNTDTLLRRFILEYRNNSAVSMKEFEPYRIQFDHLIPVDEKSEGYYYGYVPDGSYCGFEWKGGMWNYVSKMYSCALRDGEFPRAKVDENGKPVQEQQMYTPK